MAERRSSHDEVAQPIVDTTMAEKSFEAARAYPDLKILCLWCGQSVYGHAFADHGEAHRTRHREQANVPSSWMAL